MPIRKSQRHLYPKDWPAIRERILLRAGNACECIGECGSSHEDGRCDAPNHTLVERHKEDGVEIWRLHGHSTICLGERCDAVGVVLTIAHLDHDVSHNAETNLKAMCQRCHLRLDKEQHAKNAAATRASKRDQETGQQTMFGDDQ
jgi:hypothetical protein